MFPIIGRKELLYSVPCKIRSFSFPACSTVIDKMILKQRHQIVIDKAVLYNPVMIMKRQYVPFLRLVDDKMMIGIHLICSSSESFKKRGQRHS